MKARPGSVLLEVIVSLVILAFAGVAALGASRSLAATATHMSDTEATVLRADQFMASISLWPREDLDRHLGMHRRGEWMLNIQRSVPTNYDVSILDSTASYEWIRTSLYRPFPPTAGQ